jgi:hypothetical protein
MASPPEQAIEALDHNSGIDAVLCCLLFRVATPRNAHSLTDEPSESLCQ